MHRGWYAKFRGVSELGAREVCGAGENRWWPEGEGMGTKWLVSYITLGVWGGVVKRGVHKLCEGKRKEG